ncbi:MAG: ABC transporter permease [Gammaproteobacteria bacterium]|jgi:putative ABC transport system permease protein|nr:FtsX-like permease family protein [Gammaproteobacteria bacterium]MDP7297127.1 ABC transporter permease [Gammaproteobacteria bacterium]MDP7418830.1 ABC transporter permease [Gammaproteobacteria bacterium]
MRVSQIITLALRTLIRNPLRSFFMMLGVAIGIASLTAMASIGEATQQETIRQFKRMVGTYDLVSIVPGAASTRGMPSLTTVEPSLKFADATAIAEEANGVLQVAEVQNAFDIDIKYRDKTTVSAVYGVSANWLEMREYYLETGDVITQDDIASLARVAVIGQDIVTGLFPDEDPIGKQIRIGNVPFAVKGVLVSRGAGPGGGSLDGVLFIPVTTASKRLFQRDYLTTITAQLYDPSRPGPSIESIKTILRERHGIVPPGEDDFTISDPRASAEQVEEVSSTLATILTGVAIIAMIIGGTVIMSLMLIAVSERRREIGVRRAVGATRADVMLQFLIEAATVSVVGGLMGITLGVGGATLTALQQELPPVLLWDTIGLAVCVSVGIGLIFGLQPAWKAANIDPIDALQS